MNTLHIKKTVDKSWGKDTNFAAIEKLLQNNDITITPDKVERMPESYISDNKDGRIQSDKR